MKIACYYPVKKHERAKLALDSFISNPVFKKDKIVIEQIEDDFKMIKDADLCVIITWKKLQRQIAMACNSRKIPIVAIFNPPIRRPDYTIPCIEYFGVFWNRPYGGILVDNKLSNKRWKRLRKAYNIRIKPWRKKGDDILIVHQPYPNFWGNRRRDFFQEAVEASFKTGRKIKFCLRPDRGGNYLSDEVRERWKSMNCEIVYGIQDNMDNIYCAITAGGTSGSKLIFNGVPTFSNDESLIRPLMTTDNLDEFLENPQMPVREKWFNWAAYQQWTSEEMAKGLTWDYLKKIKDQVVRR